jgi:hypothetical protein
MKNKYKYIGLLLIALSLSTCNLEIENTNNPDIEDVISSPEGIKNLTAGLFSKWFQSEQGAGFSPGPAMWVAADWGTVTFANYGTVDASKEPRIALNNKAAHNHHSIIRNFWQNMYAVVTTSNTILQAADKIDLGEDEMMVRAMAHFMQGLGNGYIGLVYDKSYPSDETLEDYANLTIQPYNTSINMAVEELEKAIAIFDNNTFTIPELWMTRPFTNQELSKIANTFIARLLVYTPRNTTQNDAIDWQKVLTHAQAGITEDFYIDGNDSTWKSWYKYRMASPTWGKVDMRVIHMMDNNMPPNWPNGGLSSLPFNGLIFSPDNRANLDYQYDASNNRPERGKYRWSTYRYARFDSYLNDNLFAPVVMMRKAENDLFIAEAHANLLQYQEAADIINAGTRVTRGNLTPVTINPTEIEEAIFYERTIELSLTGMGIEFFDMRRRGLLQDGTLLHYPIPDQQLSILGIPSYTFGGVQPQYGVPNEDVSVDGWYAAPIIP